MLIPVALLLIIGSALAYLFLTAPPQRSTPLGASGLYPGGMAQITAISPLEDDGWLPPERADALDQPPEPGNHRVRLMIQFTALEPSGLKFSSSDFKVTGIGSGRVSSVWSSVDAAEVAQGRDHEATLVFELPDQAIALVLEGPGQTRLSLGHAHHVK